MTRLVLSHTALRELKVDALAREALVDLRVGIQPVVNTTPLLLVENNLQNLASILTRPHALANNLDRVHQVVEDSVVDSSERPGARALLGLRERLERLGRGRMRREAMIRTWRSENFFSSSRVRLMELDEGLSEDLEGILTAAETCASQ